MNKVTVLLISALLMNSNNAHTQQDIFAEVRAGNKEAIKIQKEASNIFSFEAFKDCKEINLRSASKIKKLAYITFALLKIVGKNNRNNK